MQSNQWVFTIFPNCLINIFVFSVRLVLPCSLAVCLRKNLCSGNTALIVTASRLVPRFRTLSKIVLPIQSELHSNFGYAPRSALSLDPEGLVYHIHSSQFELQKQNHQTQVCRRHAFI